MSKTDYAGFSRVEIVTISNDLYDNLLQEVMKLPEKKRKNFKSFLHDKLGQRSKVIYDKEKLWNYSLTFKKYVELKPSRFYDGLESENLRPLSVLGAIQKACMKVKEENQSSSIDTDKVTEHALALLVDMNHTGNHYRNHYMNVGSNIYGNVSGAK